MQSRKVALKEFFFLAVPVMLQSLSGNILNICDTMMVGKISEIAISGVTVANKTYFIYTLVIFGASSGISIFMAQFYGSGRMKICHGILRFGLFLCLGIGAAFLFLLTAAPSLAVRLYVSTPEIVDVSLTYIRIVRFSYIPAAVSLILAVYFRIVEKPYIPMFTGALSTLVNILLNYVLIYGNLGAPRLGVRGAALATLAARCLEMATAAVLFWRFYRRGERGIASLTKETKRFMIRKMIPLVCNETVWALGLTLVFRNYCRIDEAYIPSITVTDNVFDLVNVAFVGGSTAAGIIMGKILGAGHIGEAKKTAVEMIKLNLLLSMGGSLLVIVIAPLIPGIFSLAGGTHAAAVTLLRIRALFCWTYGYGETIYYILRAGGDTKAVFLVDGLCVVFGPLLFSSVLAAWGILPLQGVYLCTEASNILKVIVATVLLKRGRWLNNLTTVQAEGGTY